MAKNIRNQVLSIDECFYKTNNNEKNVDIKKVRILKNESVIFLVNDNSLRLFNSNFWKILKSNYNQLRSCFN
ncbi:hypothetical protein, partial [Mycoplasma tauri]|uniref:hypothetical protein n=1 Tax=Mycoplasma tauri TaxID=547987 RepID=UPI001CBA7BFD